MSPEMNNALGLVYQSVKKKYGEGIIFTLNDEAIPEPGDVISSGSISLDSALGVGGYKKGRIVEIYGDAGTGKTSLCLHAVANAQKLGKSCLYIDMEQTLDPNYARALGVDLDKLHVTQPDYAEQALDILDDFVHSGGIGLAIVDSVAALIPQAELEGEMGDSSIGRQALLMSKVCRKIAGICNKTGTTVIFVNQTRCLPIDSLVITQNGLQKLCNLSIGDKILGQNNEFVTVLNKHYTSKIQGKELQIKHRGNFILSNNHLQPILRDKIYCLPATQIQKQDWLIFPINNIIESYKKEIDISSLLENIYIPNNAKSFNCPTVLNEDLAFFLGYYYSDGNLLIDKTKGTYRLQFTENNTERFNLIKNNITKIFGEILVKGTYPNIYINGKLIIEFILALGLKQYGKNKDIPDLILNASDNIIKSFIRGAFFDSHGFSEKGFIFTNENPKSTLQFATLLMRFGIFGNIQSNKLKDFNQLCISGYDAIMFTQKIGFAEPTKQNKAQVFKSIKSARGKYDVVPYNFCVNLFNKIKESHIKGISSQKYYSSFRQCLFNKLNCSRLQLIEFLEELNNPVFTKEIVLLSNNRFFEITNIQDTSLEAIDIEVDKNGLFIANGTLTHNSKIGIVYGSPIVTSGGNSLKFYASMRLEIARTGDIKTNNGVIGHQTRVKIVKNKCAPPKKEATFEIIFGRGIDQDTEIINLGVEDGIIKKSGPWFKLEEQSIGQGVQNAILWLNENPEKKQEILKEILANRGLDV